MRGDRLLRALVDVQLEDVRPRVVADDVEVELAANNLRAIDVRLSGDELSHNGPRDDDWTVIYYITTPRGADLTVQQVLPIASKDYPTKAKRPLNSRLDLTRLRQTFHVTPASWSDLLEPELDAVVAEQ